MSQHETSQPESASDLLQRPSIDPNQYIGKVLDLYRQDEADYRGRRNDDQQLIAEYAAEEADEHFDAAFLGVTALTRVIGPSNASTIMPEEHMQKNATLGNLADGVSLYEMRNSWRQLWVGLNVLTNRLHRDSGEFQAQDLPEVFEMQKSDKKLLIDTMFNSFQELNALRFGAEGSGVRRHKWVTNYDTGEPERIPMDADTARSDREVAQNAARRKYTVVGSSGNPAVHAAGKMTPKEFKELRKQYPEVDMDQFAKDASYLKHMAKQYESAAE